MNYRGADMEKRKTPIMGWSSWNCFRVNIHEEKIKKQADALVNTGLADYGYTYFNLDDGFFGGRGEDGVMRYHKERFPHGIRCIRHSAPAASPTGISPCISSCSICSPPHPA